MPAPEPKLLSLPPEMRNMIWRFVLCLDNPIIINDTYQLPAVIQTCHQIRHEALIIFHSENKFEHTVNDLDASTFHKWAALSYDTLRPETFAKLRSSYLAFTGERHWGNLKDWLDVLYEGEKPSWYFNIPEADVPGPGQEIARLQAIAMSLRGQPRDVYENAMRHTHVLMRMLDPGWS